MAPVHTRRSLVIIPLQKMLKLIKVHMVFLTPSSKIKATSINYMKRLELELHYNIIIYSSFPCIYYMF
jgi:hypothetical protein